MTPAQTQAVKAALETIKEAIDAAGEQGIPSGHLYAMLMGFGCSLNQYQQLTAILIKEGKITQDGFHVLRSK